ncbi:hypothetical protein NHJ13051_002982 [Beauveria bassiana]
MTWTTNLVQVAVAHFLSLLVKESRFKDNSVIAGNVLAEKFCF